jgi:hypothetical protein
MLATTRLPTMSTCGDRLADGRHDFVGPEVQCRFADNFARSEQVDEGGGPLFKHGEGQFLNPLRHSAPDPATTVVAGLWEWVSREPARHVVDGVDVSGVPPDRGGPFVNDRS